MSISVAIECCPLCGNAIREKGGAPYREAKGLSISVVFNVNGLGSHAERFDFRKNVCEKCRGDVLSLLDPGLEYIKERRG